MVENLKNLIQNSNPDIHGSQQIPNRLSANKAMPNYIIAKLLKAKIKANLKSIQIKKIHYIRENNYIYDV